MVLRPAVRSAVWTEQWWSSYGRLAADRQASCDRVVMALVKGTHTPGLDVKPILPDRHYLEARISSGDRVVFRLEETTIYLMDVVKHDDIERYSRRPRQPR
jgi:hypothetical protein